MYEMYKRMSKKGAKSKFINSKSDYYENEKEL